MTTESEESRSALLTRLRRVEGQIRGIHRMIEDQRPCEDVVTQLMAARAALDQAGLLVVRRYVDDCLRSAQLGQPSEGLHRAIELLLKLS